MTYTFQTSVPEHNGSSSYGYLTYEVNVPEAPSTTGRPPATAWDAVRRLTSLPLIYVTYVGTMQDRG